MKITEAVFQTRFGRWFKAGGVDVVRGALGLGQGLGVDGLGLAYAFELKVVDIGERFAWKKIESHQIAALCAASGSGLFHKLTDFSVGTKPFDCFYMAGAWAFLVIGFRGTGRGAKVRFYGVEASRALQEYKRCVESGSVRGVKKSVREEEVREMSIWGGVC